MCIGASTQQTFSDLEPSFYDRVFYDNILMPYSCQLLFSHILAVKIQEVYLPKSTLSVWGSARACFLDPFVLLSSE